MRRFALSVAATAALVFASGSAFAASQSPVNITYHNTTYDNAMPALQFNYSSTEALSVVNNGSPNEFATIKANLGATDSTLTIDGDVYTLLQFHFHTLSEHEINGAKSPMEMHLVHKDASGNLAVVGRLIEVSVTDNALFTDIFDNLPTGGTPYSVASFNLQALIPSSLESFRYSGSLTTPPFTEGVAWNVLADPLYLSQRQINEFGVLFPTGDSREVQALDGRTILTDVPGFAGAPEPGTWAMMLVGFGGIGALARRRKTPVAA